LMGAFPEGTFHHDLPVVFFSCCDYKMAPLPSSLCHSGLSPETNSPRPPPPRPWHREFFEIPEGDSNSPLPIPTPLLSFPICVPSSSSVFFFQKLCDNDSRRFLLFPMRFQTITPSLDCGLQNVPPQRALQFSVYTGKGQHPF